MENQITANDLLPTNHSQGLYDLKWIADTNDNLVYANHSFPEYFGLNRDSLNRNIFDVFSKNIARFFYKTHQRVRELKNFENPHEYFLLHNGYLSNLLVNSYCIKGTVNPDLVGGEASDIKNIYIKQEDLENKKERLIYLNRTTSEAVWEWDIASGYIFRNQQLEKLTGYTLEKPGDLSWWFNRIHPANRDRVQNSVATALENKQSTWEEEYDFQCADGNYKMVRDRGFILYENDKPVRMIGSLQDLSEIKELRNQIIQEKVIHQNEIAESITRAKENERVYIGNELHDNVNQILVTARLYLEMMKPSNSHEEEIRQKTKEFIGMAFDEIRRLSKELVSPLLIGNSIVEEIQDLVNDIEASGKFRIEFLHDDSIELCQGLMITLYRIAQEQLKNCIQYSNAEQITVELKMINKEVLLTITDNGVGFDMQTVKKGMGLSNIYERVASYNGRVDLGATPGKGCCITVSIPA